MSTKTMSSYSTKSTAFWTMYHQFLLLILKFRHQFSYIFGQWKILPIMSMIGESQIMNIIYMQN